MLPPWSMLPPWASMVPPLYATAPHQYIPPQIQTFPQQFAGFAQMPPPQILPYDEAARHPFTGEPQLDMFWQPPAQPGQGTRHVGILCDGCQRRDFSGVRYKCRQCDNFDLCGPCYREMRQVLHTRSHTFEAIRTPRALPRHVIPHPSRIFDGLHPFAVFGFSLDDMDDESGLVDSEVAWWLAGDDRLVPTDRMLKEEPAWLCPICSEGIEGEATNGWVVQICSSDGDPSDEHTASTPATVRTAEYQAVPLFSSHEAAPMLSAPPLRQADSSNSDGPIRGHVYHEACLRQWLVKKNSCPVCRRSPVVPTP